MSGALAMLAHDPLTILAVGLTGLAFGILWLLCILQNGREGT